MDWIAKRIEQLYAYRAESAAPDDPPRIAYAGWNERVIPLLGELPGVCKCWQRCKDHRKVDFPFE